MKSSLLGKIVSFVLAMFMIFGASSFNIALADSILNDEPTTLTWATATNVKGIANIYLDGTEYKCVGKIIIPPDPRTNHIILKCQFQKYNDAGVGDIKLRLKLVDVSTGQIVNGTIYDMYDNTQREIHYSNTAGATLRIYVDTASLNSATANGSLRKGKIIGMQAYFD